MNIDRHVPTMARLLDKVEVQANGCWLWVGGTAYHGYGYIHDGGRLRRAHRVTYELFRGPIAAKLELDHLCRNTLCVSPAHLEPVTALENMRRGASPSMVTSRSGLCRAGLHALTPENRYPGRGGCRECARANGRERARRQRCS